MRTISNFLIALLAMAAGMTMQTDRALAGDVIGWMEIQPSEQQIQISGRAYAFRSGLIEFSLRIERSGPSGKTATKQSGRAQVDPGKVASLSTTSVNIGPGDQLSLLLTIYRDGEIVATNALKVGGE